MVQYQYPEKGWSTGRMRKRGEKLAMMPDVDNYGILDPTRGKGLVGAGGGPGMGGVGRLPDVPQAASGGAVQALEQGTSALSQIKEHLQGVQTGDITMGAFNKLLKKLGWSSQ